MVTLSEAPPSEAAPSLTSQVLRHALVAAAEEASVVVVRTAYSTFIVEGADASAAILDRSGRLIAQSTATTLAHSASLYCSLPSVLSIYPHDAIRPGDIFALNDVYSGGIHANDVLIYEPVFAEDEVLFFTGALIHVSDLGGVAAGGMASTATQIWHEGLQLPPTRVGAGGELFVDFVRLLRANSRTPDDVVGDVRALVAGTTVARHRLQELIEEYGATGLREEITDSFDYAERRLRRAIGELPDGCYRASFAIDGDGMTEDREFQVTVAVTVSGEDVTLDFTGTDDQSPGAINSGVSQTISGVLFALRCFVDADIPFNAGALRPVHFVLPEGTLVNPRWPAACGGRFVTVYAAMDAVVAALSQARPELASAAPGMIAPFSLSAATSEGGLWVHMAYDFGGGGARSGQDGVDATGPHFGIGRNTVPQVEPVESRCPIVVEAVELREDSGGAGRWRGGLGSRTTFLVLEDTEVTVRCDRHRYPPPGRSGGRPGGAGGYYRIHLDGERERLPDKATGIRVAAGERLVVETSGGGGLGAPDARDHGRVVQDVRDGRVSAVAAALEYGVTELGADG
jgi:N-methylhydantoinase B